MADDIVVDIRAEDRFTPAFSRFGASLIEINQGLELARRILGPVKDAALAIVETTDRFRRLEIQLTNLEGSSEKARQAMDQLISLGRNTPQTVATLTDAFVKLEAGGLRSSYETLTALTDAVAAFGGTDQQFERAAIAIQQMSGKGVISMEELRQQLGEAIPTAAKIMARELGLSYADFVKQVSMGNIEAQRGIDALTKGMEKDFGGAAKTMMDTWAGATSNMQDAWDQLLNTIGEQGVLQDAVDSLNGITDALRDVTAVLKSQPDLWERFKTVFATTFQMLVAPGMLAQRFIDVMHSVPIDPEILARLDQMTREAADATAALKRKQDELAKSSDFTLEKLGKLHGVLAAYETQLQLLGDTFTTVVPALSGEWDELADHIGLTLDPFNGGDPPVNSALEEMARQIRIAKADAERLGITLRDVLEPEAITPNPAGPDVQSPWDAAVAFGGQRAAMRFPGMAGAMAGFQAAGPEGALVGALTDILMAQPEVQAALTQLNEAITQVLSPLLRGVADGLEKVTGGMGPVADGLEELAPALYAIGFALGTLLLPEIIALRATMFVAEQAQRALWNTIRALDDDVQPLKDGLQHLADNISALIGAIQSLLPSGGNGGVTNSLPHPEQYIPIFDSGGVVSPGDGLPAGDASHRVIVASIGERFTMPGQPGAGGAYNFYLQSVDPRAQSEELRQLIEEMQLKGRLN